MLAIYCALLMIAPWALAPSGSESLAQALECRCGLWQFLSLPHANITPPEKAHQCRDYSWSTELLCRKATNMRTELIDARGTGKLQGVLTMFYTLIQKTLDNVPGGVSIPVEYPAGSQQNTTFGEKFVIDIINRSLRDWPNQKHGLFGYSQGTMLMLNILSRLNKALDAVASVVLLGNPYRAPGKMFSVNEFGRNRNNTSIGLVSNATTGNSTPHLPRALDRSGKVLDYCLDGDGICNYNPACDCELPATHLSYTLIETAQDTAFQHVVSHLRGAV